MRRFFLSLFFILLLCAGREARAADEVEKAKEHFTQAIQYFNEGKTYEALQEFKASYHLRPHWKIWFNIATCYYELKNYVEAAVAMSSFIKEGGGEIPEKQKIKADDMMTELKKKLAVLRFSGTTGEMVAIVDGKSIADLKPGKDMYFLPGKHEVLLKHKGNVILDEKIVLEAGVIKELRTTLVEKEGKDETRMTVGQKEEGEEEEEEDLPGAAGMSPKKKKMRTGAYATLGVSLATLALCAVMGGLVLSEQSKMQDAEDAYIAEYEGNGNPDILADLYQQQDDHYDTAQSYATASNALLGVGAGVAVVSIVLFALSAKGRKTEKRTGSAMPLLLGPGSLSLRLKF